MSLTMLFLLYGHFKASHWKFTSLVILLDICVSIWLIIYSLDGVWVMALFSGDMYRVLLLLIFLFFLIDGSLDLWVSGVWYGYWNSKFESLYLCFESFLGVLLMSLSILWKVRIREERTLFWLCWSCKRVCAFRSEICWFGCLCFLFDDVIFFRWLLYQRLYGVIMMKELLCLAFWALIRSSLSLFFSFLTFHTLCFSLNF